MATNHAKAVREYDDVYLTCRDLRHHWRLVGYYRDDGAIGRTLECERCSTQRIDHWRSDGERIASSYRYAENYQMPDGFQAYEVRREVMHRAKIYASEGAMVAALTNGRRSVA